jgi:hypothetical protein
VTREVGDGDLRRFGCLDEGILEVPFAAVHCGLLVKRVDRAAVRRDGEPRRERDDAVLRQLLDRARSSTLCHFKAMRDSVWYRALQGGLGGMRTRWRSDVCRTATAPRPGWGYCIVRGANPTLMSMSLAI